MADQYAPPSGPAPPQVPPGWTAQWNQQYQTWFYVNLHTKKSQWEQPTSPAPTALDEGAVHTGSQPTEYNGSTEPATPFYSSMSNQNVDKNNPYPNQAAGAGAITGSGNRQGEDDAALAARLQAEEDTRARTSSHSPRPDMYTHMQQDQSASHGYYSNNNQPNFNNQQQPPPPPSQGAYPAPPQYQNQNYYGAGAPAAAPLPGDGRSYRSSGGLIGKLAGKLASKSTHGGHGGYGGHGGHRGGSTSGLGGLGSLIGAAQGRNHGHGYGNHGYGGYGHGYGHGYPFNNRRKNKYGMGAAGGAAALGVGGGLVGGAMLANSFDHDHYGDGDFGGGGDDFGGGGGDFGGDFGGGGGGDFGGGD